MTKHKEPVEGWKEELSVLLLDIFLKSKPKAQKYPLGQLEKRIGDFIQSLLDQARKEERVKAIKIIDDIYDFGISRDELIDGLELGLNKEKGKI